MVGGRVGLGLACLVAPGLCLRVLGFPDAGRTARTLATMVGARDLAMALCILAASGDRATLRRVLQVCGALDVADAAVVGVAGARDRRLRRAALTNLPFAGGSALFSFVTAARAR
jgi:hypothetical protein